MPSAGVTASTGWKYAIADKSHMLLQVCLVLISAVCAIPLCRSARHLIMSGLLWVHCVPCWTCNQHSMDHTCQARVWNERGSAAEMTARGVGV